MKNSLFKKNKKRKNKTQKIPKIQGEILSKKEGWITLQINGSPYQRGFAHGFLLYKEMRDVMKMFLFSIQKDFKISLRQYLNLCKEKIKPHIMVHFPEFYEEMKGIADGFKTRGLHINIDYIIGWNSFLSMDSYFDNKKKDSRCSAFIATGDATEKGDIIMAHNTHSDFLIGRVMNIVMYITPETGFPFVMQTSPGLIASSTDWFLCSTGMIGCETTISDISYLPEFGAPYYCRIRQAMQYGKSIDEYIDIMLKNNAGDYACSWQFGDIKTNEIALFEIGLREHSIQRTKNGVYYGMNQAIDPNLRFKETTNEDIYDVTKSSGARNLRFNQLLNTTYYGKLNTTNAKKILSDHYDVYLHSEVMNARTICKHVELDGEGINREPYYYYGATDGKLVNSEMARKLQFMGRYGSSCGRDFRAKEYLRKHPEFKEVQGLLEDIPKQDWVILGKK
jgi:hypothetical protein